MTISATNQGLRSGVCTSTSRPSSPFAGQLIFETDTNRLAVWNGTSWVFLADADTPSGLQLVKTQTIGSAVSSVTVTNAFSSEFENYRISIIGGVTSLNNNLILTLGSTATGYYRFAVYGAFNASTVSGSNVSNGTGWTDVVQGNTESFYGEVILSRPFETDRTHMTSQTSTSTTTGLYVSQGGFLNNDTSYTDFTLTTSTGTITGGTIRVYGYRNS